MLPHANALLHCRVRLNALCHGARLLVLAARRRVARAVRRVEPPPLLKARHAVRQLVAPLVKGRRHVLQQRRRDPVDVHVFELLDHLAHRHTFVRVGVEYAVVKEAQVVPLNVEGAVFLCHCVRKSAHKQKAWTVASFNLVDVLINVLLTTSCFVRLLLGRALSHVLCQLHVGRKDMEQHDGCAFCLAPNSCEAVHVATKSALLRLDNFLIG
mmetsp:Transcript_15098/g.38808  ORF Transcript_15098/g.38808 Transcript_15098/m.38808 type:complete len:212 (-) Transcript_15098:223-858(-)